MTASNLKAEIIDMMVNGQPVGSAAKLFTGRYASGRAELGTSWRAPFELRIAA